MLEKREWHLLCAVYAAIVADAVASSIMTPFAPDFVEEGLGLPAQWAGFYAGLMVGLFGFAVAVSAPLLGGLSDRYGRRPLMIFGLASACVFTLMLFSTTKLSVAVFARLMAGLTDSTQSVAYACIGDVATGEDRTLAFAYSSAAFQVARILSSVIGGYTVDIDFSLTGEADNDFLLPAFISAVMCAVSLVAVYLFMHETAPRALSRRRPHVEVESLQLLLLSEPLQGSHLTHPSTAVNQTSREIPTHESISDPSIASASASFFPRYAAPRHEFDLAKPAFDPSTPPVAPASPSLLSPSHRRVRSKESQQLKMNELASPSSQHPRTTSSVRQQQQQPESDTTALSSEPRSDEEDLGSDETSESVVTPLQVSPTSQTQSPAAFRFAPEAVGAASPSSVSSPSFGAIITSFSSPITHHATPPHSLTRTSATSSLPPLNPRVLSPVPDVFHREQEHTDLIHDVSVASSRAPFHVLADQRVEEKTVHLPHQPVSSLREDLSHMFDGFVFVWRHALLRRVVFVYSMLNFLNGAILVLIPLICLATAEKHGLGMTMANVGLVMLVFASWATLYQLTIFKLLIKRYNMIRLNAAGCVLMGVGCLILPLAGYVTLAAQPSAVWFLAVLSMLVMASGFMLCASLVNTMISNLTPRAQQGSIQGASRSLAALFRASGPLFCGTLFSVAGKFPMLVFAINAMLYLGCAVMMMPVHPEEVEKSAK